MQLISYKNRISPIQLLLLCKKKKHCLNGIKISQHVEVCHILSVFIYHEIVSQVIY